jgi:hypothetical protein
LELANTKRDASRTGKGISYVMRKQDMVVIVVQRLKWKEGNVRLCKETFMTRGDTHEHENNKVFSYQRVNEFDESVVGIRGEVI